MDNRSTSTKDEMMNKGDESDDGGDKEEKQKNEYVERLVNDIVRLYKLKLDDDQVAKWVLFRVVCFLVVCWFLTHPNLLLSLSQSCLWFQIFLCPSFVSLFLRSLPVLLHLRCLYHCFLANRLFALAFQVLSSTNIFVAHRIL